MSQTKSKKRRSLVQLLGGGALVSALAVAAVWGTRAQTASAKEILESESVDAVLAELLSKPIPAYTRAFDQFVGRMSSNEVQALAKMDSREINAQIEALKSPAEKQADDLTMFAVFHPVEYAAVVSILAPVRDLAPEEMSDGDLALFVTTNSAPLSKTVAERLKRLPSLDAMARAAQTSLDASPPPDTVNLPSPMVPSWLPKDPGPQ